MKRSRRTEEASAFDERDSTAFPSSTPSSEASRVFSDGNQTRNSNQLTPTTERQRACLLHVRALNKQFTSWVQAQLKEHGDELWTDGVRDYIHHASSILADFKEVADWLSSKPANASVEPQPTAYSKPDAAFPDSTATVTTSPFSSAGLGASTLDQQKPRVPMWGSFLSGSNGGVGSAQTSSIFGGGVTFGNSASATVPTTLSSGGGFRTGIFSAPSTGPPSLFNIPATPLNVAQPALQGSAEAAEEGKDDEEERPPSPSLKKAEEPGVKVLYETRSKLYVQGDSKEWKDMGFGMLSLKAYPPSDGREEAPPRVHFRTEVGRLLINALLYKGMDTSVTKTKVMVALFSTHESESASSDGGGTVSKRYMYLIKVASEEKAAELSKTLLANAPR